MVAAFAFLVHETDTVILLVRFLVDLERLTNNVRAKMPQLYIREGFPPQLFIHQHFI